MNCNEFQDRLPELLDHVPPVLGAACESHLTECPRCRESFDEMLALGEAIQNWRSTTPAPSTEFPTRVISALRTPEPGVHPVVDSVSRRSHERPWIAIIAATAAALLIGIFIVKTAPQPTVVETASTQSGDLQIKRPEASTTGQPTVIASGSNRSAATTDANDLFRETAIALRGAADALLPGNTAIASVPAKASSATSGSAGDRAEHKQPSLAQEITETFGDLLLASETADSQT